MLTQDRFSRMLALVKFTRLSLDLVQAHGLSNIDRVACILSSAGN